MKKAITFILTLAVLSVLAIPVFAENTDTTVYVSIANGDLLLAYEPVTVTDADLDGTLTVNDALICAHNAKYEGGADAGYTASETDYGLSLYKLWGIENGGSYGYCVNNASAMSLLDPVKHGDHVYAYVYTDLVTYSDTYSYFDAVFTDGGLTLTLYSSGYDANWMPVTNPVSGAVITVDGIETEYVTDENGKVTLPENVIFLDKTVTVSAKSDTMTLVPPVHTVIDEPADAPQTGDEALVLALALVLSLGTAVSVRRIYAK